MLWGASKVSLIIVLSFSICRCSWSYQRWKGCPRYFEFQSVKGQTVLRATRRGRSEIRACLCPTHHTEVFEDRSIGEQCRHHVRPLQADGGWLWVALCHQLPRSLPADALAHATAACGWTWRQERAHRECQLVRESDWSHQLQGYQWTVSESTATTKLSPCINIISFSICSKYYYPGTAYSQSKLAQILFTRHLQRVVDAEKAHVQVHVVHPGIVDTELFEHSATTSVPFMKKLLFKTPERGSRTVVFAAIDPSIEGQGGTYLSNCGKGHFHADAKQPKKCEELFQFSCDLLKIKQYGNGQ